MVSEHFDGFVDALLLLNGWVWDDIWVVWLNVVEYRIAIASDSTSSTLIEMIAWIARGSLLSHVCGMSCGDVAVVRHLCGRDREGPIKEGQLALGVYLEGLNSQAE